MIVGDTLHIMLIGFVCGILYVLIKIGKGKEGLYHE